MSTIIRVMSAVLLLVALPAVASDTTSVTSVTPLPNHQVRVCWEPVDDASAYWIEGSDDVENVVVMNVAGVEPCRDVNLFGAADCSYGFVTVSIAPTGDDVTFGPASERFYFLHGTAFAEQSGEVSIDALAAPPICSAPDQYPTIEASTRLGPSGVVVRDVTRASDDRPRVRIEMKCADALLNPATGLDHYEIYESTIKNDGSTSTRTTKRSGCPDGTELTGEWGDRTTFTVAAIFRDHDSLSHSFCSAPRVVTYGSALLAPPSVRVESTKSIRGTAAKGTRNLLVVSLTGERLGRIENVAADGSFSSTIDIAGDERTFVVARRVVNGHDVFSDPVPIVLRDETRRELTLNDLPAFTVSPGLLFVSGITEPFQRVHVRLSDGTKPLSEADLFSCANGTFGGDMALDDADAGEYVITASSGPASVEQRIHLNEVYPAPQISLDQGTGPFRVDASRVIVSGRVTPVLQSSAPFENTDEKQEASSPYELTATLNDGEPNEITVDQNGDFLATITQLRKGSNNIVFLVKHRATDAESKPFEIAIERGRGATGVDLEAANKALGQSWTDLGSGGDDNARRSATEAILINPSSPRAYAVRAAAAIRAGDAEAAYKDALRATELDPRSYEGLAYRTNLFIRNAQWNDVIDYATRAIVLNPALVLAWDNRSLARLQIGRFDQAISDATSSIALDRSNAFALQVRAKAYLLKHDFASAITDAREAVSLAPEDNAARVTYALTLHHFGNSDAALEQLQAITDAHPESESVWNTRAWAEYKMGLFDRSVEDAAHSISLQENPFAYGTRAWSRAAKGDVAGALEDLDKAASLEKNYSGQELDSGLALYLRGDYSGASKTWREALAKYGDESDAVTPLLEKAEAKSGSAP